MSNSTTSRSRTYGINERVAQPDISEWRIKTWDQLPGQLKHLLEKLPPYLTTARAAELNGGSRSKLYEDADAGRVQSVKSDGSRLWETASILIRLANLPPASISPAPSRQPRKAKIAAAPATEQQHITESVNVTA
jgi:hypothetical protein